MKDLDHPCSVSSAVFSDNLGEDVHSDWISKPLPDPTKEKPPIKIQLYEYEGLAKVIDYLAKRQEDYSGMTIKIECYPGQLNEREIPAIFNQYPLLAKIELIGHDTK